MGNAITSLAVLKVNWDHLKKDYIENFIPFIATLIKKYNYETIDVDTVCSDFKKEFGLIIPYHPMYTILNRAQKRGLIKKRYGAFKPNKDKVDEFEFARIADEQLSKQDKIIKEFISFANRNYSVEWTDPHRVAMELLEEKTMGEPNNFTDKTSEEIIEEIREGIKKEGEEKYLKEKEHLKETLLKLDTTKKEKEGIEKNIEKKAENISAVLGKILFGVLLILIVSGTAAQFSPNLLSNRPLLRAILILFTVLLGLLSVATGFNIKGLRDKIKIIIKNKIIRWLIGENTDNEKKQKETV